MSATPTNTIVPQNGGGNAVVCLPRARSFARWRRLAFSRHSLYRALEYEAISGVRLSGCVLDIGGDPQSGYHGLFEGSPQIETVNLNSATFPTHKFDLEAPLPLADASYAHVISLSTFEHIRNDEVAVAEAIRVLAPGGMFHFVVPFLYRVHGSPRDFHRHTAEWWGSLLTTYGVKEYKIEPLVWDQFSTGVAVAGVGRTLRALTMLIGMLDLPRFRWLIAGQSAALPERDQIRANHTATFALGYYMTGIKPLGVQNSSS